MLSDMEYESQIVFRRLNTWSSSTLKMLVSPVYFDGYENLKNRTRNIQSISCSRKFKKQTSHRLSIAKFLLDYKNKGLEMPSNLYIKTDKDHDFIRSQESGECSIILQRKNYSAEDGYKGEMIESTLQEIASNDGHYHHVYTATEDAYKNYVYANHLMVPQSARKRSLHGLKTFEIAKKLFPVQEQHFSASKELRKLVQHVRRCKVAELLAKSPSKKKRALENRLSRLSNDCAGVANIKNLTEEQAHCIIHYTRGVDPELILGHR